MKTRCAQTPDWQYLVGYALLLGSNSASYPNTWTQKVYIYIYISIYL